MSVWQRIKMIAERPYQNKEFTDFLESQWLSVDQNYFSYTKALDIKYQLDKKLLEENYK